MHLHAFGKFNLGSINLHKPISLISLTVSFKVVSVVGVTDLVDLPKSSYKKEIASLIVTGRFGQIHESGKYGVGQTNLRK